MALNPALLGAAIIAGVQPTDPISPLIWLAISAAWIPWTIANVVANPLGGTPLVAVGPIITGTGNLIVGPPQPLGLLLAAACGSVDAEGLDKWQKVAAHYTQTLAAAGGVNPAALVAYAAPPPAPQPGPVTGTGLLTLTVDFDFATALDVTDTPGVQKWTAIGSALKTHLALGMVTPAMFNPAPAGPVTGSGTVS